MIYISSLNALQVLLLHWQAQHIRQLPLEYAQAHRLRLCELQASGGADQAAGKAQSAVGSARGTVDSGVGAAKGNIDSVHRDLHHKYGSAVRIGPNCISVSDPKLIRTIYATKNPWIKASCTFLGLRRS